MATQPWIRGIFTEIAEGLQCNQTRDAGISPVCANYEMNALECLEAYGYFRGDRYCRDYIEDWDECLKGDKQNHRYVLMAVERGKAVAAGKRRPVFDEIWGKRPNPEGFWDYGFRK